MVTKERTGRKVFESGGGASRGVEMWIALQRLWEILVNAFEL